MANVRLNKVIELLERGQAVFSCGTVPNGNYDEITALSRSSYDLIVLEMEHLGFDFPPCAIRSSMSSIANALPRKAICNLTSSLWCAFRRTRGSRTRG